MNFIFVISYSQTCADLPIHFASYKQAIDTIENFSFQMSDGANTYNNHWIKSAHFYSCSGDLGILILKTDTSEYIHANVPIVLWLQFKDTDSSDSFYNANIKNKYIFKLNTQ